MGEATAGKASDARRGARGVVIALAAVVVGAALLLGLLRVFIRPIPPDQVAPAGHFGGPCALCHLVSESAEPADVR